MPAPLPVLDQPLVAPQSEIALLHPTVHDSGVPLSPRPNVFAFKSWHREHNSGHSSLEGSHAAVRQDGGPLGFRCPQ
eukprot:10601468-Alexandrium_andersonii.AAC.1